MKKVSWSWEKLGHCVKEDKYTFCVDILKMKSFANKEARAPHYIFIKASHFGIAWFECILLTKKYVSSRYPFETLIVLYTYLILVSLLLIEHMRKNGYFNISYLLRRTLDNFSDAILSPRKRNITYPIFMHNQFRLNDDVVIEELSLPW